MLEKMLKEGTDAGAQMIEEMKGKSDDNTIKYMESVVERAREAHLDEAIATGCNTPKDYVTLTMAFGGNAAKFVNESDVIQRASKGTSSEYGRESILFRQSKE